MMGHDCQQVRDLLDSYLSDELLVETNHQVLHHLGRCSGCSAELARRKNLRHTLTEALQVKAPTGALEQRILAQIQSTGTLWSRLKPRLIWGAASALILIAGSVFWWTGRPGQHLATDRVPAREVDARVDEAVYHDSVSNHRQCALSYPASLRVEQAHAAAKLRPPYQGLLSAINLDNLGYELIEAHVCRNGPRTFAHVILDVGGSPASLFATEKSQGGLPSGEAVLYSDPFGLPVHEIQNQGFEVAAVETRGYFFFVISDLSRQGNARLATRVAPAVVRFLSTQGTR